MENCGRAVCSPSLREKAFGVGPDCFMPYSYSIPEYADKLYQYWKPNILTNAHNEFLNLLICIGIAGLLAFIAMLCMGVARFTVHHGKVH